MKTTILILISLAIIFTSCETGEKESQESNKETSNNLPESKSGPEKVEFPSLDSLLITANIYEIDPESPVILLCHQARFNKYEYEGIAQQLNNLGFNCIAIDQRSGGPIVDNPNETTLRALEKGKPIDYLDAEQDIIAAINYTSERYNQPVILWGSSYSSTLALYIGLKNENVSAIVSFSPGNYFAEQKGSLIESLPDLQKPFFITSSNYEIQFIEELLQNVELQDNQVWFKPQGEGHHGSRALWKSQAEGDEYWDAIEEFLTTIIN